MKNAMISSSVGQAFNQGGHVNFTFKNPSNSSMTHIPGLGGNFVGSESSQNYLNMQNSGNPYGINNQQGLCGQSHYGHQPMQQDHPYNYNNHQNPCPPVPLNPCLCSPGIGQQQQQQQQQQMIPCGNFLPQNILDQIRNCVGNTAPIFILPQAPLTQQNPPPPQVPAGLMGYAPNYPPPSPQSLQDHYNTQNRSQVCNCCRRTNSPNRKNPMEENEGHRCCPGSDDTVCTRPNCPASINLQALASQLLSLQGVIPCAATRLVLRKVPGSNVTTGVDETMERAQKSISTLTKEQLINESRNALQVTGMINLHMVSNPPQNIVPVLTMLQLKVNALKATVESLLNRSIGECQSVGLATLDSTVLGIKSDAELREILNTLRRKECEERVNVSYAPYHSQRVVAESRLANFQNKINQVEAEMERRRSAAMPWANPGQFAQGLTKFDSPSPFMVQVKNPKKLNLRPNVGGAETTYDEAFTVSKLENKEEKSVCSNEPVKEEKKKLKIHIDEKGELSVKRQSLEGLEVGEFVQVSSDVVIVIDKVKPKEEEPKRVKILKKSKKQKHKQKDKKSEESIPSDYSTCSDSSVSSQEQRPQDEKAKPSNRRNLFRRKKKTPKSEIGDELMDEASIKKEEREDVVMLSEILQGRFPFRDDKDTRRSNSVSILEAGLETVDDLDPIQSLQTVSARREASASSDLPEEHQETTEGKSCVLKELAQNQSSDFSAGGSVNRKNCARDEENVMLEGRSKVSRRKKQKVSINFKKSVFGKNFTAVSP